MTVNKRAFAGSQPRDRRHQTARRHAAPANAQQQTVFGRPRVPRHQTAFRREPALRSPSPNGLLADSVGLEMFGLQSLDDLPKAQELV